MAVNYADFSAMENKKSVFHFKQFCIDHSQCAMKVGTDGVLLGAWVDLPRGERFLDVGTGSGLIALMLAQRSSPAVLIDAIEPAPADAHQAELNVAASPWPQKVAVHCVALQEFAPARQYNLIVSNPPYFTNSYKPPDRKRLSARHTVTLPPSELLKGVARLLSPGGRFAVILPLEEGTKFRIMALDYDLCCSRLTSFRSRASKPVERLLMEFSPGSCGKISPGELTYLNEKNAWSDEYRLLTREFYLGC